MLCVCVKGIWLLCKRPNYILLRTDIQRVTPIMMFPLRLVDSISSKESVYYDDIRLAPNCPSSTRAAVPSVCSWISSIIRFIISCCCSNRGTNYSNSSIILQLTFTDDEILPALRAASGWEIVSIFLL